MLIWFHLANYLRSRRQDHSEITAGFNETVDERRIETLQGRITRGQQAYTLHDMRFMMVQLEAARAELAKLRSRTPPAS